MLETCQKCLSLSGNTFRVGYQLRIRHTLGTMFEVHQTSENTYRYFHIIKNKTMYSLSYAVQYYRVLVVFVSLKTFADFQNTSKLYYSGSVLSKRKKSTETINS